MKLSVFQLLCGVVLFGAVSVSAATRYVSIGNATPAAPFTSWATAATNIQAAVDAAVAGDEIVVTNGVYDAGATLVYGMSNRVAVTKPVTVRSVNGPGVTTIQGYQVPGVFNGASAVRCVYLTHNSMLAGFTLTGGATQTAGNQFTDFPAGGVWCEGVTAVVSNCVIINNRAKDTGGGAYSGTLINCQLIGNYAYNGGGAWLSTLINCSLTSNWAAAGGGGGGCTLSNCFIAWNSGTYYGGGMVNGYLHNCVITGNSGKFGGGDYYSVLTSCIIVDNSSGRYGGGANNSTLYNCVIAGNRATDAGGGAYQGTLNNCISYYNTTGTNVENYYNSALNYCCTTPLPAGPGNFTNAPLFVDANGWANLRLQSNSPCINAGTNAYAVEANDLDGKPRIVGGTVDIGAYEYQSPYQTWLLQYGMPTDGSVDQLDLDGDLHKTWQEWIAGTNPTNAGSVLRMLAVSNNLSGITVVWSSVINRTYSLERATNMGALPVFGLVRSNLIGLSGSASFTDTNVIGSSRFFYRVCAEQ